MWIIIQMKHVYSLMLQKMEQKQKQKNTVNEMTFNIIAHV